MSNSKKAFVVMPITTPHELYENDKDHFLHVYEHLFKPSLEKAGYDSIFPKTKGSDIIHADIIRNLEEADLVLCDLSILNPNVFFELGIRTALNKPVCLVKDNKTKNIPFDTSIINYHEYESSLAPWKLGDEINILTEHISDTLEKTPDSNALWQIFGLKESGIPIEKDARSETKILKLENELLNTKIEKIQKQKELDNSVHVEKRSFINCSNCSYGISVEGLDGILASMPPLSTKVQFVSANIYNKPKVEEQNSVKCPNCGNIEAI